MYKLLMVGTGGFVGAVLRYLVSGIVQKYIGTISFPWGTFVVNILGCFLIGAFSQVDDIKNVFSSDARMFLFIGLFGAFTTYSTFSNETMKLINENDFLYAFANVSLHIVIGLLALWLGRGVTLYMWR